jgi:hypothetical protein
LLKDIAPAAVLVSENHGNAICRKHLAHVGFVAFGEVVLVSEAEVGYGITSRRVKHIVPIDARISAVRFQRVE